MFTHRDACVPGWNFPGEARTWSLGRSEMSGGQNTGTPVGNFCSWIDRQEIIPKWEGQSKGRKQVENPEEEADAESKVHCGMAERIHNGKNLGRACIRGVFNPFLYLRRAPST